MIVFALVAHAEAAEVGGYLRVMTRPDFEGGDGRLGYWNLYGRLLNEGPYAALELRQAVLEPHPGSTDVWSDLHAKIEGGSIQSADGGGGSLVNFRLSQVYAQAGNIALANVTWRVGTLESNFGDLGLYDMRPTQILSDTLGMSARYQPGPIDLTIGAGDAGYSIHGVAYNTVFSGGGALRARLGKHVELGFGGQAYYEPAVEGNRNAPYDTPGITTKNWLQGKVVESWLDEHPNQESEFPDPVATDARSYKAVAYVGVGNAGPIRWNGLYASWTRRHPLGPTTETVEGADYTLYVTSLTDERDELVVGDELQMTIVPDRLDISVAGLYGNATDEDNDLAPTNDDRTYYSTVLRTQIYLVPTVHLLVETSIAKEISHNGNTFRNHYDSLFENTNGQPDGDGLEMGDSAERDTWQGKAGIVLNPMGPGIYTRPSLRLMYGLQYSTQNNAFGNSFVDTLDQFNSFGNVERHWHNVIALEAEAWF